MKILRKVMNILFKCTKQPQVLLSCSHETELFISVPLEYKLNYIHLFGQWWSSKNNTSRSLKNVIFCYYVNELLDDERL